MTYTAWVPHLPPSVNALYHILYHLRRVELKPDVRQFKTQVKLYLPPAPATLPDRLSVDIAIYADWYTQQGGIRRYDVQNLVKVFLDAVCEHLGVDDSRCFRVTVEKCTLDERHVVPGIAVTITEYVC